VSQCIRKILTLDSGIVEFVDEAGTVLAQTDIVDTNQIVKLRIRAIRQAA